MEVAYGGDLWITLAVELFLTKMQYRGINTDRMISLPPHFHDYYELGYIESGSRRVICQGKEYTIGKNDLLLFNPNDNHTCLELEKELFDLDVFTSLPNAWKNWHWNV